MGSSPKVSIIVPIYNAEKFLDRTIPAILAQSYTDYELLLINDGSTDKSLDICNYYSTQDKRITVINKPNGGVSSARNVGLENAHGQFVTFCDADDYVDSEWLSAFFKTHSADLVVQSYWKEGCSQDQLTFEPFQGDVSEGLLILQEKRSLGYLWVKLFKKSIIDKYQIRFDESKSLLEDELFVLMYCQYCDTISLTNDRHYHYSVPNWGQKYVFSDAFGYQMSLEPIINKICKGNRKNKFYSYMISYTAYLLMDGYTKGTRENQNDLALFRNTLGWDVLLVDDISIAVKIILLLPTAIGHRVLKLKHRK